MRLDLVHITATLYGILKRNAPMRGKNMPTSWPERKRINYLKPTKLSPYPGNLKNNGINCDFRNNTSKIEIGGEPAPYADYTEKRSFSPGWIAKSEQELLSKLRQAGGRIR